MTTNSNSFVLEDHLSQEDIRKVIISCEEKGQIIERPENSLQYRALTCAMNDILAGRLTDRRNITGLNNEKINSLMHGAYMERNRNPKAWTFTNILSSKTRYLPDSEEVEMLSNILRGDKELFSIHLKVTPWIEREEFRRREERRKRREQRQERRGRVAQKVSAIAKEKTDAAEKNPAENREVIETTTTVKMEKKKFPSALVAARPSKVIPKENTTQGDIKISNEGDKIVISGKIWCDKKTAGLLRMIVPIKLIKQGAPNDLWSYEIYGPIHGYQLYNLAHVLYGTPKVLTVDLEK